MNGFNIFNIIRLSCKSNDALYDIQRFYFQSSVSLNLTEAGPHSVEIVVTDYAGNTKSARRIFLFDNASVVEMYGNPIKVLQANKDSWINNFHDEITVAWQNRFRNIRHSNNGWLNAVADNKISRLLDDRDGRSSRTTEKIDNIEGDWLFNYNNLNFIGITFSFSNISAIVNPR